MLSPERQNTMSQSIKAMVDEFCKKDVLTSPETFESQARYDVMMALVGVVNKSHPLQIVAEAVKLLSKAEKSNAKTEDLFEDYLEASKSKYFNKHDLKEYLDEMRAPFYVSGKPGGSYGRRSYDYAAQDFTFGGSSPTSPSTLHGEQMATVEEAYAFRKRYLPLYIEILQDILQKA